MRTLFDANAVLRHLLDDIPAQADVATKAIEDGASVTPEIIAECVYVLAGPYKLDRTIIASTLAALLEEVECERAKIVQEALKIYASTKLDFIDCIVAATNRLANQPVLTFDKELIRFIG